MSRISSSMQKIINIISIVSFVLVAKLVGLSVFGYFWITNENNQKMLQDKLMEKVTESIKMPNLSSPVLPTRPPTGVPKLPEF